MNKNEFEQKFTQQNFPFLTFNLWRTTLHRAGDGIHHRLGDVVEFLVWKVLLSEFLFEFVLIHLVIHEHGKDALIESAADTVNMSLSCIRLFRMALWVILIHSDQS